MGIKGVEEQKAIHNVIIVPKNCNMAARQARRAMGTSGHKLGSDQPQLSHWEEAVGCRKISGQ